MSSALRSTAGREPLVKAPFLLHGTEAAHGVRHHDRAGLRVAPSPGRDLLAAKSTDTTQANRHRPALIIELHGGHERRPARRTPSGFAAARRSPPRYASSSFTRPPKGRVWSRSFITIRKGLMKAPPFAQGIRFFTRDKGRTLALALCEEPAWVDTKETGGEVSQSAAVFRHRPHHRPRPGSIDGQRPGQEAHRQGRRHEQDLEFHH